MEIKQYEQECKRTFDVHADTIENINHAVHGIGGESGEIIEYVKKWRYNGHDFDSYVVAEELGDLLWYIVLMSNAVGFSLEEVMEMNVRKRNKRYPEGFDTERSINRDDEEEFYEDQYEAFIREYEKTLNIYNQHSRTDMHAEICAELNNTYTKKNMDYGNSFSKSYEEDGLVMAKIRLNDKMNRFAQLINPKYEAQIEEEKIEDTLLDLANYAIMTVMELRNGKVQNTATIDYNSVNRSTTADYVQNPYTVTSNTI